MTGSEAAACWPRSLSECNAADGSCRAFLRASETDEARVRLWELSESMTADRSTAFASSMRFAIVRDEVALPILAQGGMVSDWFDSGSASL